MITFIGMAVPLGTSMSTMCVYIKSHELHMQSFLFSSYKAWQG